MTQKRTAEILITQGVQKLEELEKAAESLRIGPYSKPRFIATGFLDFWLTKINIHDLNQFREAREKGLV